MNCSVTELVLTILPAYGMTESCSCITAHPPGKYDYKYGHTVGTICASTEVKVIDLDGKELGLNEPGEVSYHETPPLWPLILNTTDLDKGATDHDGLSQ